MLPCQPFESVVDVRALMKMFRFAPLLWMLLCSSVFSQEEPLLALPAGKVTALEAVPVLKAVKVVPHPLAGMPTELDEVVRLQIYLDQILFGPGFIDGRAGNFTRKAVYAYNRSLGREPGNWKTIREEVRDRVGETYATAIVPEFAKDYVNPALPTARSGQAKEKQMSYRSYAEFMAERYHTSEDFLIELNTRKKVWGLQPRDAILVPNIDPFLIEQFVAGRMLKEETELSNRTVIIDTKWNQLFVYGPGEEVRPSGAQAAMIVLEEEEEVDHRKLIAVFPITPGRPQFIHRGKWKIANCVEFPRWGYDKEFLETGRRSKSKDSVLSIPGGPNNPVGVVWSGLTKSGIGIHGTSSPKTIGRSVSAGCIRLSNWDAGRFPKLVRPGATVVIR